MSQVTKKLIENNYEIGPSRLFLEYDANSNLSKNGKKELENVLMANFYFNFGSFVLEDDENKKEILEILYGDKCVEHQKEIEGETNKMVKELNESVYNEFSENRINMKEEIERAIEGVRLELEEAAEAPVAAEEAAEAAAAPAKAAAAKAPAAAKVPVAVAASAEAETETAAAAKLAAAAKAAAAAGEGQAAKAAGGGKIKTKKNGNKRLQRRTKKKQKGGADNPTLSSETGKLAPPPPLTMEVIFKRLVKLPIQGVERKSSNFPLPYYGIEYSQIKANKFKDVPQKYYERFINFDKKKEPQYKTLCCARMAKFDEASGKLINTSGSFCTNVSQQPSNIFATCKYHTCFICGFPKFANVKYCSLCVCEKITKVEFKKESSNSNVHILSSKLTKQYEMFISMMIKEFQKLQTSTPEQDITIGRAKSHLLETAPGRPSPEQQPVFHGNMLLPPPPTKKSNPLQNQCSRVGAKGVCYNNNLDNCSFCHLHACPLKLTTNYNIICGREKASGDKYCSFHEFPHNIKLTQDYFGFFRNFKAKELREIKKKENPALVREASEEIPSEIAKHIIEERGKYNELVNENNHSAIKKKYEGYKLEVQEGQAEPPHLYEEIDSTIGRGVDYAVPAEKTGYAQSAVETGADYAAGVSQPITITQDGKEYEVPPNVKVMRTIEIYPQNYSESSKVLGYEIPDEYEPSVDESFVDKQPPTDEQLNAELKHYVPVNYDLGQYELKDKEEGGAKILTIKKGEFKIYDITYEESEATRPKLNFTDETYEASEAKLKFTDNTYELSGEDAANIYHQAIVNSIHDREIFKIPIIRERPKPEGHIYAQPFVKLREYENTYIEGGNIIKYIHKNGNARPYETFVINTLKVIKALPLKQANGKFRNINGALKLPIIEKITDPGESDKSFFKGKSEDYFKITYKNYFNNYISLEDLIRSNDSDGILDYYFPVHENSGEIIHLNDNPAGPDGNKYYLENIHTKATRWLNPVEKKIANSVLKEDGTVKSVKKADGTFKAEREPYSFASNLTSKFNSIMKNGDNFTKMMACVIVILRELNYNSYFCHGNLHAKNILVKIPKKMMDGTDLKDSQGKHRNIMFINFENSELILKDSTQFRVYPNSFLYESVLRTYYKEQFKKLCKTRKDFNEKYGNTDPIERLPDGKSGDPDTILVRHLKMLFNNIPEDETNTLFKKIKYLNDSNFINYLLHLSDVLLVTTGNSLPYESCKRHQDIMMYGTRVFFKMTNQNSDNTFNHLPYENYTPHEDLSRCNSSYQMIKQLYDMAFEIFRNNL